ncbi:MAG: YbaB/EbfC family nucleoid-associated protein [Deltaproteobacteria bacterium]|nr:YbaB/EbfC family nucleoid-associated protein [Deltaproteobacteria bacterium]
MQIRGGLSELMRQASRMQRKIEKRKEELKSETVEASSGGGQVTAVVNGGRELVSLKITPEVLEGDDVDLIHDLIVSAVNAGLKKAGEMVDAEIEKVTGGVKVPGLY